MAIETHHHLGRSRTAPPPPPSRRTVSTVRSHMAALLDPQTSPTVRFALGPDTGIELGVSLCTLAQTSSFSFESPSILARVAEWASLVLAGIVRYQPQNMGHVDEFEDARLWTEAADASFARATAELSLNLLEITVRVLRRAGAGVLSDAALAWMLETAAALRPTEQDLSIGQLLSIPEALRDDDSDESPPHVRFDLAHCPAHERRCFVAPFESPEARARALDVLEGFVPAVQAALSAALLNPDVIHAWYRTALAAVPHWHAFWASVLVLVAEIGPEGDVWGGTVAVTPGALLWLARLEESQRSARGRWAARFLAEASQEDARQRRIGRAENGVMQLERGPLG